MSGNAAMSAPAQQIILNLYVLVVRGKELRVRMRAVGNRDLAAEPSVVAGPLRMSSRSAWRNGTVWPQLGMSSLCQPEKVAHGDDDKQVGCCTAHVGGNSQKDPC